MISKSLACVLAAAMYATAAMAQTPQLVTEDMMVKSPDAGIEIYVRNKRPAGLTTFRPERTILFVHGSTYPASTSFDLRLDGMSWMDYIASRGYDVYLLDLRGYGKSTRPKEMTEDAKNNAPIVRGDTAVKDIGTAVDFILARRNIPRLNLLGWSWGTTLMTTYTAQNSSKVERLIIYAPQWIRTTPSLIQTGAGPIPAYRTVTQAQARARRITGIPEPLFPAGWFEAWADATWATDPIGAKANPPVLRAPNGTVQDTAEYWSAGRAYYDPAKITVPTLLVLAEGAHGIIMERNRLKLFEAVQAFLDEAGRS